jgi:hypothetical protein
MRNLYIILAALIIAGVATYVIGRSEMATDGRGTKIEAFTPLHKNDTALTGYSQTIDVTDAMAWGAYVAADTKFRCMSTATKAGVQHTLPAGSWFVEPIANPGKVADYTYLNFSTVGGTGTFRSDKP